MPAPDLSNILHSLRIGIDIGGTFTDFVVFQPKTGRLDTFKLLSTPQNPAEAVLAGLQKILSAPLVEDQSGYGISIVHGSTVATNALLERKGASTALITSAGFKDVLQIGRQNRPALYDLFANPPDPLVPAHLRLEVSERVDANGLVITPLDPGSLSDLIPSLQAEGVISIAVCLLFSFLHPEHEQMIAQRLRPAGFFVSLSSEILPEYREYERMSTTVVNAYVSPVLDRYLSHLERAVPETGAGGARLSVMQSNGGVIRLDEARRSGVRCILSGPAGGIVGSQYLAGIRGDRPVKLITFDMGGTSTDVSLIDGQPGLTTESIVGGCPISIPVLDIHTIGAGGGSLARVDPGGALRVGPESAGAYPGPACYGRVPAEDCQPTVTDANLVLGRLAPEYFLGGQMQLDSQLAQAALARLGAELGLDPVEAALGVVEVANAHMERALRLISVERGHDPGDFTLLSFGGAGGLHAADLARRLGIPCLLAPPGASTLSAFGMLAAEVAKDYSQTVMLPGDASPEQLFLILERMVTQAVGDLQAEGIPPEDRQFIRLFDLRYRGQSYELTVAWPDGPAEKALQALIDRFHAAHQNAYGYSRPEAVIEIVNARLRALGRVPPPPLAPQTDDGPDPAAARLGSRPVMVGRRTSSGSVARAELPLYRGEALLPGNRIDGPALVVRSDTTVYLGPTDRATVDPFQNLIVLVGSE